jgi:type II secretory pathway component PulF
MNKIPLKEQIIFVKRLALIIKSGTPLLQGLQMLNGHGSSKRMAKILPQVIADVEHGQYLATALGKFRKSFGEFAINIIEIGEVSGTLPENLNYLAEELKKKQTLRRKVVGALVYPAFMVVATFGITILLTIYLFPKILPIFKSVNFSLPVTTRLLIFVSSLLINHGALILLLGIVLIVTALLLMRIPRIRFIYQRTILATPILGNLVQVYNLANICRTLGLLLKSNVAIVRTAKITSRTTDNLVYREHLNEIAETLTKGEQISGYIQKHPHLFPAILTQMVTIGEKTGNLSHTFLYLADMYEAEVDDITKNLSTVLEPILLVLMGLMVGFVAISIITPIYGLTQRLHP